MGTRAAPSGLFGEKVVAPICRLAVGIGGGYLRPVMVQPAKSAAPRKARSPVLRGLWFVFGLLCLALIPLSYLPGIPTFDLILLAAFFFSMSSDKMYGWMINHPYFGKVIRGYRDYGLTMRMKWVAAIAISTSLLVSGVFLTDLLWIRLILGAVGVYAIWFVFSRPTRDLSTDS
ncbi:MAG: YbaN family protein [Acidimicrobiia bacterium]